jgi:hypothetical protein
MPWVFGRLSGELRFCDECGYVATEWDMHWHPETEDKMVKAMSMDEFGPISADYFHGRRVERVDVAKPHARTEDEPVWEIVMEGNAHIQNFDPTIPPPTAIIGAALTRTILESGRTRLQFGLEQVTLNPIEYAILDEHYTRGIRVYAQRSSYNMPRSLPDDPSAQRAVEAPERHPDEPGEPGDG